MTGVIDAAVSDDGSGAPDAARLTAEHVDAEPPRRPTEDVAVVEELVRGAGGHLRRHELASRARQAFDNPTLPGAIVDQLVAQSTVLRVTDTGVVDDIGAAPDDAIVRPSGSALRAVAVDLETVAIPIPEPPYVRAVPYQLGAVRFGTDAGWVSAHDPLRCWLPVSDEVEALLEDPGRRAAVATAPPATTSITQLRAVLDGADTIVAYNGHAVDFPVLEHLLGQLPSDAATVDGLYLAHVVWPRRSGVAGHALFRLADELDLDLVDHDRTLGAHDALDDSLVLVRLLGAAAVQYTRWSDDERRVLGAATAGSAAWRVLLLLAGQEPPTDTRTVEVASALNRLIHRIAALRDPLTGEPLKPVTGFRVDDQLQVDGRTDPGALVSAVRGTAAQTRETQARMLETLRQVRTGRSALIEAPTGTGKSAAMLAAAFDHLAANDRHRVIISTFTRQLQRQLGSDLEALTASGLIPALSDAVDLIKGGYNRLSLRALSTAVIDLATDEDADARPGSHDHQRRELVAYLLRRMLVNLTEKDTKLLDVWDARSVDPGDLPGLFATHCGTSLDGWLADLSQGRAGEHLWQADNPASTRTRTASEALASSRLAITNHALLLRSDATTKTDAPFGGSTPDRDTLVLLDEAHTLEDAATAAIEVSVDSLQLETVGTDALRIVEHLDEHDEDAAELDVALRAYEARLATEDVPRAIGRLLDLQQRDSGDHIGSPGRVTVAATHNDARTIQLGRMLHKRLATLAQLLDALGSAANRIHLRSHPNPSDLRTRQTRIATTGHALAEVLDDLGALLGVPAADAGPTGTSSGSGRATPTDHDPDNRVIWVEQLPSPAFARRGWRSLGFRLVTSPVELASEPRWQRFRSSRPATALISGTLRIPAAADPWRFSRQRYGLDADVLAVTLPSPFDPASQTLLVAFEDFPSWTEQPEAARRTLAHQLAGYAREVTRRPPGQAAWNHGAMVLTTSRADAAGIAELLLRAHAGRIDAPRIHPAVVVGNASAIEDLRREGGVLVGTKGLWQGVDIDDPDRLSLVWINKLPFPSPGDPVLEQRIARAHDRARAQGAGDPEQVALEHRYLPLAAIELRQGVGRLLRTTEHRGVIVISDRRLAGSTRQRRQYRQLLLGSLDEGYVDMADDQPGALTTMQSGWRRIFDFLAGQQVITAKRAEELGADPHLERFVWLEETRRIRAQAMSIADVESARAAGDLEDEVLHRSAIVGGALKLQTEPVRLHEKQVEAIRAIARGDDLLALLPTGAGKSFIFQLPALILPGVTLVVSPLVSLMTEQTLSLNRTIGGAVRALTGPMRESSSRIGQAELAAQLTDPGCEHGIRLVYLSPERLVQRQLREQVRTGVRSGIVRRIVFDEAHTLAQWGEDFRPQIRRTEAFVRELHAEVPALQLIAVTATATPGVVDHLRRHVFGQQHPTLERAPDDFVEVRANPIRTDLAVYRRLLTPTDREAAHETTLAIVLRVLAHVNGHAIVYALTIREVEALHAALSEQVGRRWSVLRYHGKLSPTEQIATLDAFVTAARQGEEGYRRMVVIATSAFGLGIDRPDIRAVLVASPPLDLAALYQQLGRAGRDQRGRPLTDLEHTPVLAMLTPQSWDTLQFMLTARPGTEATLRDIGDRLLATDGPVIDIEELADQLAKESGDDTNAAGRSGHLRAAYQAMVVRVFALMAATGHLEDQGDIPETVRLRAGSLDAGDDELASALLEAADGHEEVEVLALWDRLPPRLRRELGDPGNCVAEMLLLEANGQLDVARRTSRPYRQLTVFRRLRETLDPALPGQALARLIQGQHELEQVRGWFEPDGSSCANEDLRRYFETDHLPSETCMTAANRCSSCWQLPQHGIDRRPATFAAFHLDGPPPAMPAGRRVIDTGPGIGESILQVLRDYSTGLFTNALHAVLQGRRSFQAGQRSYDLFPVLLSSRAHGSHPDARLDQVNDALDHLRSQGLIDVSPGKGYWQAAEHLSDIER